MTLYKLVKVIVALSMIELGNADVYTRDRKAFDKNDFTDPEENRNYTDGEISAVDLPLYWDKDKIKEEEDRPKDLVNIWNY